MRIFVELLPHWLILTGLYWTLVWGGGIEWIHQRDEGHSSWAQPAVWKKVWHLIWGLGTAALVVAGVFDWVG